MPTADQLLALIYDGPIPRHMRDLAREMGDRFVAAWLGLTPETLQAETDPMRIESTENGACRQTNAVRRDEAKREKMITARRNDMTAALVDQTRRTSRCTEADLRRRGFTQAEIVQFGPLAREEAARRAPDLADPERALAIGAEETAS